MLTPLIPNLTSVRQALTTNLQILQPKSEAGQLITYALVATALVGLMIYHYIKQQEALN